MVKAKPLLQKIYSGKHRHRIKICKVKRLAVFGSYANGLADSHSDIDFLVDFKESADLLDQVALKQELETLFKRRVDVVIPSALSKYFRDRVLKEAVYLALIPDCHQAGLTNSPSTKGQGLIGAQLPLRESQA